jgi:hypothetical protein
MTAARSWLSQFGTDAQPAAASFLDAMLLRAKRSGRGLVHRLLGLMVRELTLMTRDPTAGLLPCVRNKGTTHSFLG